MKYKICLIAILCLVNFGYAQVTYEWGDKFDFDPKAEMEPKFVLKDNYNHFLLTVLNKDGMMSKHQVILRKFDQKNHLVETFTQDFPKLDANTLYNYLGSSETGTGKVVVFTQSYSGKEKKSEIYKTEFDKATSKFTSTVLASNPIQSAMKSGDVLMRKSENGNYIGINYTMYRVKDEPEKNLILILNANTLEVVWQKEAAFDDKYYTPEFTVTNSGKAVLLRSAKGFKKHNYLVLVTAEGQEIKNLDAEVILQTPKAISIGTQDYILAFNAPIKGVRSGDYNDLLLYDLQFGKIIGNNKIEGLNVRGVSGVEFRNITLQNNEIQIFAEAKVELEMQTTHTVGSFSSMPAGPSYTFGPSQLIIMGFDGKIKMIKPLNVNTGSVADLYHSFGMVNIKGDYYINTGVLGGIYPLSAEANYQENKVKTIPLYVRQDSDRDNIKYVNQLIHYFPDSNRLVVARVAENNNQMSLVNIFGMK